MQKTPGNALIHSRRKKKAFSACHALQSARMAPKPRPKCPDGLPVSTFLAVCLKLLVRRRKNDKHNLAYFPSDTLL